MKFGLPEHVIARISTVLAQLPQIERATIYGSRAMGTHRSGSDIDLTLHGDLLTDDHLLQLEPRLDDLLLPYSLDISRFDALHNSDLIEHIKRVGKEFYRRQPM